MIAPIEGVQVYLRFLSQQQKKPDEPEDPEESFEDIFNEELRKRGFKNEYKKNDYSDLQSNT